MFIREDGLEDLVEAARCQSKDDTPEMNEIVRRFDGLTVAVATSLTPDVHLREDLANAGRMAVAAAVRNHQLGRPGFPAYAKIYVVGAEKRELHQWIQTSLPKGFEGVNINDESDAQTLFKTSEAQPPTPDRSWGSASTVEAVDHLNDRQKSLLQVRFVEDLALASIAELEGTSQAAVSQRLSTVLGVIERYLAA